MSERRILKWPVPVDDQEHVIGAGPVVHVACLDGDPRIVYVWTDEGGYPRSLQQLMGQEHRARVYGTGQPLPPADSYQHVGSAVVDHGPAGCLVWHVLAHYTAPQQA